MSLAFPGGQSIHPGLFMYIYMDFNFGIVYESGCMCDEWSSIDVVLELCINPSMNLEVALINGINKINKGLSLHWYMYIYRLVL